MNFFILHTHQQLHMLRALTVIGRLPIANETHHGSKITRSSLQETVSATFVTLQVPSHRQENLMLGGVHDRGTQAHKTRYPMGLAALWRSMQYTRPTRVGHSSHASFDTGLWQKCHYASTSVEKTSSSTPVEGFQESFFPFFTVLPSPIKVSVVELASERVETIWKEKSTSPTNSCTRFTT